jgi:hypothetical protein
MMTLLYRILTYALLPIAALLGLGALMFLMMALANPALFLPVFTTAATVIYIVASLIFLQTAILGNKACKKSLRDWIRVNAFVAIIVAAGSLMQGISLLRDPAVVKAMEEQYSAMAAQSGNDAPLPFDMAVLMRAVAWFVIGFAVALITHISLGFRLLKQYAGYFAL